MQVDLLTKEDLKQFKAELLEQIGQLLAQSGAAGGEVKSQWLRSAQVRAMMSISPGTLQNLRINGTLRYRKVGGIMFYALSDIQAMMEGGASND